MYNHSGKPQVRYSLTELSKSLFFLLETKKLSDISVTELCQNAGLSRRTFYRNCEDKTDLICYATDCLVNELLSSVDLSSEDAYALYLNFFRFWHQNKIFLTILYRNRLFDYFLEEFVIVCNASLRYPLQESSLSHIQHKSIKRKYSNAFTIGGLGQMLWQWSSDGFVLSAEELANTIVFLSPVTQK